MAGDCGGCSMCCKLLGIEELEKPAKSWCPHHNKGSCGIYQGRPPSCQIFECLWLQKQHELNPLPDRLRPDKSKVVMYTVLHEEGPLFMVNVDPTRPNAWKDPAIVSIMMQVARQGGIVFLLLGERGWQVKPKGYKMAELIELDINIGKFGALSSTGAKVGGERKLLRLM
jgi:hypothetical protein